MLHQGRCSTVARRAAAGRATDPDAGDGPPRVGTRASPIARFSATPCSLFCPPRGADLRATSSRLSATEGLTVTVGLPQPNAPSRSRRTQKVKDAQSIEQAPATRSRATAAAARTAAGSAVSESGPAVSDVTYRWFGRTNPVHRIGLRAAMTLILVATVWVGMPAPVGAQSRVYAGGAFTFVTQTHSGPDQPLGGTRSGGSLLLGVRVTPRYSVEFEPSFGGTYSSESHLLSRSVLDRACRRQKAEHLLHVPAADAGWCSRASRWRELREHEDQPACHDGEQDVLR